MSEIVVTKKSSNWKSVIKGALVSISITLVLILLFAFVLRYTNLSDRWIFPVNQVIKVISLFVGITIAVKCAKEKGFIKGILIALLYFVLNLIIFSILQGRFSFSLSHIYDMLLTILAGGLIGVIIVNIIK